ncbi:unnamed protein product [Closterium sp. NIES-54]
MALRPSSVPQGVVLPEPPTSFLPHVPDPESDLARPASPTLTRLLATVVSNPDLESTAAFSLVTELVDFAARSRLDYVASLVTESESICPPFDGGELALSSDVLEDRQFELECLTAALPRFASMLLCPEGDPDAFDIPTPRSNAEAIAGGLHEEIWLRRPPGFTGSFPAGTQWSFRQPVYGLGQAPREWHDTLRTTLAALGFAPSTANLSLFLRIDTTLAPFCVLVYVDDLVFAIADTEVLALVKAELQERHTCIDLGELRSYLGLQITRDRARRTITLTQSHMVHQVFQRSGFQFSSPLPIPLSTGHSLSAPPSDESVEPSGPYPELVGCLMYLMTCTRLDLAYLLSHLAHYVAPGRYRKVHWDVVKRVLRYFCSTSGMGLVLGGQGSVVLTGHSDASWANEQATQRSSQGYTFSLGSGSVSWRSTRSSSVLGSSCEAVIYAGAMTALELRWLAYLLTDLGERPRSPPVLARELQQRRQLRLSYVASPANTADVFTKALGQVAHTNVMALQDVVSDSMVGELGRASKRQRTEKALVRHDANTQPNIRGYSLSITATGRQHSDAGGDLVDKLPPALWYRIFYHLLQRPCQAASPHAADSPRFCREGNASAGNGGSNAAETATTGGSYALRRLAAPREKDRTQAEREDARVLLRKEGASACWLHARNAAWYGASWPLLCCALASKRLLHHVASFAVRMRESVQLELLSWWL